MNKPIIILGNGGHASVLTEILLAQGHRIIGFTAPTEESNQFGLNYLGNDTAIENYSPFEVALVLGIGMLGINSTRRKIFCQFKKMNYQFQSVIHPSAIISPSAEIGEGVQIMAGVIIQTNVSIADNTVINTGTIIDHDSIISNNVHIAPGCKLSGNVHIKEGCFIGAGTTIIHGIVVDENCLVGAGTLLVKSFSKCKKLYGNPAREIN